MIFRKIKKLNAVVKIPFIFYVYFEVSKCFKILHLLEIQILPLLSENFLSSIQHTCSQLDFFVIIYKNEKNQRLLCSSQ